MNEGPPALIPVPFVNPKETWGGLYQGAFRAIAMPADQVLTAGTSSSRVHFARRYNDNPGRGLLGLAFMVRGTAWTGGASNGTRMGVYSVLDVADLLPNALLASGVNTSAKASSGYFEHIFAAPILPPQTELLIAWQADGPTAGNFSAVLNPRYKIIASAINANFSTKTAAEGGADYAYAGGLPADLSALAVSKYTPGGAGGTVGWVPDMLPILLWE